MSYLNSIFNRKKQRRDLKESEGEEIETIPEKTEAYPDDSNKQTEYEIVEREILPEKIICPDCGGITLEGLDFCDKCGGELQ